MEWILVLSDFCRHLLAQGLGCIVLKRLGLQQTSIELRGFIQHLVKVNLVELFHSLVLFLTGPSLQWTINLFEESLVRLLVSKAAGLSFSLL